MTSFFVFYHGRIIGLIFCIVLIVLVGGGGGEDGVVVLVPFNFLRHVLNFFEISNRIISTARTVDINFLWTIVGVGSSTNTVVDDFLGGEIVRMWWLAVSFSAFGDSLDSQVNQQHEYGTTKEAERSIEICLVARVTRILKAKITLLKDFDKGDIRHDTCRNSKRRRQHTTRC